jgi:glycosyltransferase involved in cell wall biosynthesis
MLSSGSSNWRKRTTLIGSGHSRLLKILHIDPEKNWGGGEVQVVGLLAYLARQGHHNHLLTHPQGRLLEQSLKLPLKSFPLAVRNELDIRAIPKIRRLIRNEKYDIVHFHTKRAHALAPWLPHGADRPRYVVTRRMDYPQAKNWYTRCLYNHSVDAVIAISRPIADILIEGGVDAERIRVIHSGIDAARFSGRGRENTNDRNPLMIGTVAHLEARKGQRTLLEAARLLKTQGYTFKLVLGGDGSLRQALEQMAQSLGLQQEVTFLGFISDVPKFLASLDIFVLPSLYEGLGVAALEAMAAGKAVVASRVGGLAELVTDSETGFLVSPGDAQALAAAVAKLIGDKNLRAAFGQNGAARVREQFTIEQMAKKTEDCYYAILRDAVKDDAIHENVS